MRKSLIKLVQILDGTPAVYGKRQAGQSVVELALVTPILIILLAGLVEIGWFANNYLSLLDVTRAGARRATVLQDQLSPLFWEDKHSYVPNAELPLEYQMPNGLVTVGSETLDYGSDADRYEFRWYPNRTDACRPEQVDRRFYNEVICTMITVMEPLKLNPDNGVDDIVVTGYSLQMVDASVNPNWIVPYPRRPINGNVPQMVVAGRYPTNANECDVSLVAGTPVRGARTVDNLRDPFDINGNDHRDVQDTLNPDFSMATFTELEGYDALGSTFETAEKQIGFSLFGNHRIPNTYCIGSEWTVQRVEALMNLPQYLPETGTSVIEERGVMPSTGLVIVEMFWEHEMLLKIPVLSPVFTAVGDEEGKMVISVWAAFPLPTVQPYILFS